MKEALIVFVIALAIGSFLNSVGGVNGLMGWKPEPTPILDGSGGDGGGGGTTSGDAHASSVVPEVKDSTFDSEVLKSEKPVLVYFYAPWCGPCKKLAPIVDQVAERYSSDMKVFKMNIDENSITADKYQMNSIPRLYIYKNGDLLERIEGAAPKAELVALVEKTLALDPRPVQ